MANVKRIVGEIQSLGCTLVPESTLKGVVDLYHHTGPGKTGGFQTFKKKKS